MFVLGDAVRRLALGGALQNRRSRPEASRDRRPDAIGGPVCFAVYRDGEIGIVAFADTSCVPAVDEWAGPPLNREVRLLPAVEQLPCGTTGLRGSLMFSIGI